VGVTPTSDAVFCAELPPPPLLLPLPDVVLPPPVPVFPVPVVPVPVVPVPVFPVPVVPVPVVPVPPLLPVVGFPVLPVAPVVPDDVVPVPLVVRVVCWNAESGRRVPPHAVSRTSTDNTEIRDRCWRFDALRRCRR
jgi:hypothetical protein